MSANEETERVEGWGPAVTNEIWGHREPAKRVWVRLDAVMLRNPGIPIRQNAAGIDMTGEVPGILFYWIPTGRGDWMGMVDYDVQYLDGRTLRLRQQLLPSYTVRERIEE
ncbi:hypothetical protein [Nocardia xishanensis]|uniref:hypothetical protein n=1 Tax=Nocardia xishanensis TaxID=238964 RepID=UPI00082AE592|nr:hypothetical protein [Nocardia xishanensis]